MLNPRVQCIPQHLRLAWLGKKAENVSPIDGLDRGVQVGVASQRMRTVSGVLSRTLLRNSAPFITGIRMSEITTE